MSTPILFKRNDPAACMPTRGTVEAAGFDLTAVTVNRVPGDPGLLICDTGLSVAFAPGHVLKVFARSGLARKHNVTLANGVGIIDADYRGPLVVMLRVPIGLVDYLTNKVITPGTRIAQCILEKLPHTEWQEVDELPESLRGHGGFGSTGT